MSNLIEHARRELTAIGEEPETIDWYCRVIEAFTSFGHSGGSASVAIPTINALLLFQNLSELTTDPSEWNHISSDQTGGEEVWQSARNPEAFSSDGGLTYQLLSEGGRESGPVHRSKRKSLLEKARGN